MSRVEEQQPESVHTPTPTTLAGKIKIVAIVIGVFALLVVAGMLK